LLPHLLDFTTLVLDFLLLLLQLALGLLIFYLTVLQLIANYIAAACAKRTTYSCPRAGVTNSSTDYRAGTGTQ
jgi:hypothetical protein